MNQNNGSQKARNFPFQNKGGKQKWSERQYLKHLRHNRIFAQPGQHRCVVILDNLKPSFNVGKIFRSGDAFGVREIHLINIQFFPPTSAKGSFKWVPAYFHDTFHSCYLSLKDDGYSFFILDPTAEDMLMDAQLPERSAFIFGNEEHGISFDPEQYCSIEKTRVPQYGRVESLNVSIAASITLYEYLRQNSGG